MRPQAVLSVLGMHRSGTSCVAGTLAAVGVAMGATPSSGGRFNPRGNHENHEIVIFHELILQRLGGSWHDPPAEVVWADRDRTQALNFMAAAPAGARCGWKDPRTLLHWHEWQRLGLTLQPVGVVRHPDRCARSLAARDAMDRSAALALWVRYNEILLGAYERDPFPIVNFDLPGPALVASLQDLAGWLGLEAEGAAGFFDQQLRNTAPHGGQDSEVPEEVVDLHRRLVAAASGWPEAAG